MSGVPDQLDLWMVLSTANPISLAIVFIFGTLIGSFLNVCIYRIPVGRSIVTPGSACGICGVPLQWWQNVPILSYLALGGSCWYCKTPYASRYMLIEALTGLMAAAFYRHFHPTFEFVYYFTLGCMLIVVFFIDLDYWIIPDSISIGGMVAGLLGSMLLRGPVTMITPFLDVITFRYWPDWLAHLTVSLIGAVIGYAFFAAIAVVGTLLARQEAMGGGDVKLAALIGAFLGWERAMQSFILAFWIGGMIALPVYFLRGKRKDPIPFGTFMAVGVIVTLLWGEVLVNWFLRLGNPGY